MLFCQTYITEEAPFRDLCVVITSLLATGLASFLLLLFFSFTQTVFKTLGWFFICDLKMRARVYLLSPCEWSSRFNSKRFVLLWSLHYFLHLACISVPVYISVFAGYQQVTVVLKKVRTATEFQPVYRYRRMKNVNASDGELKFEAVSECHCPGIPLNSGKSRHSCGVLPRSSVQWRTAAS